ncbi:rhomboid family intramembrane serine protease [Corynebacterium riegelii]|uniref:rhomboid family intramembrane serine protease n=1 Tax=Corynebacterium riegelii TaxID=156976 RepID=UPI001F308BC5|nr:rhomboid family intramembrane serine protease [Corynebacterium riegelii]
MSALQTRSLTQVVWGSSLAEHMILYGPEVTGLGYSRALTSGFLHLDATHLFLNMLMLVLVGAEVERAIGTGPFVVAYGGFTLASASMVLAGAFGVPTAGASGALFALMAVLVALAYRRHADLIAPLTLLAVNVGYTFVATNVSVWGHVGGLLVGALVAWPLTSTSKKARWVTAWVCLGLSVLAVWLPTLPMATPVY